MYTPHQVLLAQAVGADYAAPYLGRMSDGDLSGLLASNSAFAFQQHRDGDVASGISSKGATNGKLSSMEVVSRLSYLAGAGFAGRPLIPFHLPKAHPEAPLQLFGQQQSGHQSGTSGVLMQRPCCGLVLQVGYLFFSGVLHG